MDRILANHTTNVTLLVTLHQSNRIESIIEENKASIETRFFIAFLIHFKAAAFFLTNY